MSIHQAIRDVFKAWPTVNSIHFALKDDRYSSDVVSGGERIEIIGINSEEIYYNPKEEMSNEDKSFLVDLGMKVEDFKDFTEKITTVISSHNLSLSVYKPYTFMKNGTFKAGREVRES